MYEYVSKAEWKPVKDELDEIIRRLQDEVRDHFTFQFHFVGSSHRNMITRDINSNVGFDFDVNLEVNDPDKEYSAKEIRAIIRDALNKINHSYSTMQTQTVWRNFAYNTPIFSYGSVSGYDYVEDSTRVLTMKVKDRENARILYSCDFCIVNNYEDRGKISQEYIHYNKKQNEYYWAEQSKGYLNLPIKIDWIKKNGLWGNLRDYYLYKKNVNKDEKKHSRAIFAESVHEIWQKYKQ